MIDYNTADIYTNIDKISNNNKLLNDIEDDVDVAENDLTFIANDDNQLSSSKFNENYLNKLNNTILSNFNLIDYFKNETSSSSPSSSSVSSFNYPMSSKKLYNNEFINGIITNSAKINDYGSNEIEIDSGSIVNIDNDDANFNMFSMAASAAAASTSLPSLSTSYDYGQLNLINEYNNNNSTILNNLNLNLTNNLDVINDTLMLSHCPDFNDQEFARFEFWICGVILNFVGILGILGNILSMIILSRPQMRSSINYLLIGLARCDTVLIITSILLFGIPSIYPYTGYLFYYYYYIYPNISPCVFPIAMAAQTSSVYMTFTVTLERYVAVCHPLKARALCTYGRAKIYFIVCIIFAFVYNIPRFWEVIVITDTLNYNNNNIPIYNNMNSNHNSHHNNNKYYHNNNNNHSGHHVNVNAGNNLNNNINNGARSPITNSNSNNNSNRINFNNSINSNNSNTINGFSNSYSDSNSNSINFDLDSNSSPISDLFLNNDFNNSNNNNNNNNNYNNIEDDNVIFCVIASSLRRNDQYINIYIHWCYLIFIYFIPFLSLAILNCLIYRQVQKANRERQRLSRTERREIGLATMLLCVVIVFFLLNFLALYTNILEAFYDIIDDYLIKISNLLVTINSSANFIIYVIFGEKFKRIFLLLFCKGRMTRDTPDLIHYESSISNGDGNNRSSGRFSRHGTQRSTTALNLTRSNNNIMSNNNNNNINNNNNNTNNNNGIPTSVRITTKRIKRNRAPSPGPCVYYPARDVQRTQTVVTPSSSLHFDCYNNKNGSMMTSGF